MNDTKTLLWAAVEDYAGMWEAVWELRSIHPEASAESLESTAREILTQLIDQGDIELYWCQEPYRETTLIPEDQARRILESADAFTNRRRMGCRSGSAPLQPVRLVT